MLGNVNLEHRLDSSYMVEDSQNGEAGAMADTIIGKVKRLGLIHIWIIVYYLSL